MCLGVSLSEPGASRGIPGGPGGNHAVRSGTSLGYPAVSRGNQTHPYDWGALTWGRFSVSFYTITSDFRFFQSYGILD